MLPLINQAMMFGYGSSQILNFISSKMPQLQKGIEAAKKNGFDEEKILNFLSHKIPKSKQGIQKQLNANDQYMSSIGLKTREERDETKSKFLSGALGVGAGALGSYALSRAIPKGLTSLLQQGTNSQVQNQSLSAPQQITPQSNNPISPDESVPSQQPPVSVEPSIAQTPEIEQPEVKTLNPVDVLEKAKSKSKVDELIKAGNGPDEIVGFFKKFHPNIVKEIEKDAKIDFGNVVNSYMAESEKKIADESKAALQPKEIPEEEVKAPEKGSYVASPQGMGEIKEIRNGQALVEVDGKLHKVKEEELIQPPIPQKDLADLYDDVISGIEKESGQEVSKNVEWAGYDPNKNELAYKPHGSGKLYVYDNISPEDVQILTNFLTVRKTSGSNHIGAWEKDTKSPIGAAMHQLIMKLQKERGGKGNEYKNRYDTIYDALEPAKEASKKKHAERKKQAKKSRPS